MKHKDKWLPIVLMMLTTLIAMGGFYWIKSWDSTWLLPVADVAGEETDATVGRLIVCAVYFFGSLAAAVFAVRLRKKSPDRFALPWALAAWGGTLLWVSVGECSWHFGFNVMSDEGEMLFTNFPRIESVQGIPLMVLTLLALAAVRKKASFPLMSYALAFAANWYGHICMIGVYPIAMACGIEVEMPVFYRTSGLIHTFLFAAAGLFLIWRKKTKRENRYYAAVLLYIALGTLMFGVMMGET